MKTPIYDALQAYADRQPIRFHMPGHKGHSAIPAWNPLYALDITEISGADSLLEADGIIAESEQIATALFSLLEQSIPVPVLRDAFKPC